MHASVAPDSAIVHTRPASFLHASPRLLGQLPDALSRVSRFLSGLRVDQQLGWPFEPSVGVAGAPRDEDGQDEEDGDATKRRCREDWRSTGGRAGAEDGNDRATRRRMAAPSASQLVGLAW